MKKIIFSLFWVIIVSCGGPDSRFSKANIVQMNRVQNGLKEGAQIQLVEPGYWVENSKVKESAYIAFRVKGAGVEKTTGGKQPIAVWAFLNGTEKIGLTFAANNTAIKYSDYPGGSNANKRGEKYWETEPDCAALILFVNANTNN